MKRKSEKEMLETGEVEGTMREMYRQLKLLAVKVKKMEGK